MLQAAKLETVDEDLTVAEVATAALVKAKGDVGKATEIMHEKILSDHRVYRQLMDPLVKNACYDAVRQRCRSQRRIIWKSWQPSQERERSRIESLADGTISSLLNFRLQNGMMLRNAMQNDLVEAADRYAKQAADENHKAHWLRLIAKQLPARKKVGDVMKDEQLAKLLDEAGHE